MMRNYIHFTKIMSWNLLSISIYDTESGDFKGFEKIRITKDDGGWSIRTLSNGDDKYQIIVEGIKQLNIAKYFANVMYNSEYNHEDTDDVIMLLRCCGISPTSKFYQTATGHNGE
ncbi:MAG: hypothetical protein GY941_10775 [Planctomycetes bacterium]|nr:hypothetical protein [Planctomycetota bacterium]